jgi:penicillin-binding protein 1A
MSSERSESRPPSTPPVGSDTAQQSDATGAAAASDTVRDDAKAASDTVRDEKPPASSDIVRDEKPPVSSGVVHEGQLAEDDPMRDSNPVAGEAPAGGGPPAQAAGEAKLEESPGGAARPSEVKRARAARGQRVLQWVKRIAIAAGVLLLLAALTVVLVIRHYEAGLPSTQELKSYDPPQVTRVLARDGTVLGEVFTERRTLISIDRIPSHVKLAVLAAEDAAFYEHAGLSYFGMLRALAVNLRSMRARQGAGTITQQVVRNVLLTQEKTFDRKMREIILARRIEDELTKDEILELYLNHIYFGHGRYGIEEAARFYFGKSVREVSLGEAALIAGIVKGPNIYSPRVDVTRAKERQSYVLGQMQTKGFARPDQVEAAKKEPIVLAPEPELMSELAPEVVSEVKRALRELVGIAADRGGYTVETTIDPAAQAAARAAVRKNLDDYAVRKKVMAPLVKSKKEPAPYQGTPSGWRAYSGVVTGADDQKGTLTVQVGSVSGEVELRGAARYNPKNLPPSKFAEVGKVVRVTLIAPPIEPAHQEPEVEAPAPKPAPPTKLRLDLGPQGALVAIDVRTREIVALVGSYEAVRAGLDRATNARRQPGSTFKTFVYSYGIHARTLTPATILETDPFKLSGADYKPGNYDESEGKSPARLREALAHSVNVAAVSAMQRVGATNVVAWAHGLGIESKLGADLSLALGSYEVTPREMTAAYATLAAGGVYEPPVLIKKITGPNGVDVPLPARPPSRRVMDEAEAYVMTNLLTSVVKTGTAKRAASLGRPIAGKTGTSNKEKDAWFVGYSTDFVCGVWTGFDDASPLGAGEVGAVAALPAFIEFMREAHKKRPPADFPVPAGIVRVSIDPATGLRAYEDQEDAIEEVFVAGTEPTDVAEPDAGVDGGEGSDPEDAGAAGASPAAPEVPAPAPSPSVIIPPFGDPPPF